MSATPIGLSKRNEAGFFGNEFGAGDSCKRRGICERNVAKSRIARGHGLFALS
jgi:hypothetical protein